jgi:hypothetical protein
MKSVAVALAASFSVASLVACSHTVEGEGTGGSTRSASEVQPLPAAGEACRCTSPSGQIPPNSCCESGLICGDSTGMPGQMLCDALGCWRAGICVESPLADRPSSSGSSGSSGLPEPPPDECSPFKRNNDTCPPGKECHLVRDHWGCV